VLVVAHDAVEAQGMLEQAVEHVEPDLVGREPGALGRHAAEGARGHGAVLVAAPRATPVLEQRELDRRLLDEVLDHVLVAQEVGPLHRVPGVHLEAVVFPGDRRRPALGGDGVAAHRVDLGDESDAQPGIRLDRRNRGPQTRSAAAHDDDVVLKHLDHGEVPSR